MKVDVIVAGGGLAGAILAWTLRRQGRTVALFDAPPGPACSLAAAGLYHPLTGRRLSLAWRLPDLLLSGERLFQSIGTAAGRPCLHRLTIRRSFIDRAMAETWERKRHDASRAGLEVRDFEPGPDDLTESPYGGYELDGCGWVDPGVVIQTVTEALEREGRLHRRAVAPHDLGSSRSERITCGGIEAGAVVFAEGHLARHNPLWSRLPLKPNHGEILELRIDQPLRECIHLGEIYLVPRGGGRWLAGATHDWTIDHGRPTPEGRRFLEDRLRLFLRSGFEVTGHRAGVRPASGDTLPFVGRHPDDPRVWVFNGFGSRALLLAPYCAERLGLACFGTGTLPEEIDSRRIETRRPGQPKPFRATRAAQERIGEVLRSGDVAVDATAGRGHDTLWLAAQVGPTGHVLACDRQPCAIRSTRRRVSAAGFSGRTTLVEADHAELGRLVPADWHRRIGAVLFNLGPLSRGDRRIRTRPASTLRGLEAALGLLRPGGLLTVILHPGEPEGQEEARAVQRWAENLDPDLFETEAVRAPASTGSTAPWVLILTRRDGSGDG